MNVISFQNIQRFLIGALLFLTSIAVFVPLSPDFPKEGLDPSWMFTLNEAVSRNWVFGKDIIFTFGPYASIITKLYHPDIDRLILCGSIFLSICYASLLFLYFKKPKMKWALIYALFIAGFHVHDLLLSSYPFILGFFTYRLTLPEDHPDKIKIGPHFHKFLPIFYAPLGLLLLIKGSVLPLCAVTVLFCFIFFLRAKQKPLAFGAPLVTGLSCCAFWLFSGQPISAIFSYFLNITRIAFNYTAAMWIQGNTHEIYLSIISSLLILWCLSSIKNNSTTNKLFLLFFVLSFLFIEFKTAFIRHDGHAVIAGRFTIIVLIILMTVNLNKPILIITSLFSILISGIIDNAYFRISTKNTFQNTFNTYSKLYEGTKLRASSRNKLKKKFENRLSKIHNTFPVKKLVGSTDIYSFQQAYLLSSENELSLRPVFQSYSAYSPELIKMNEAFLRSEKAPENIIFRIEPIDARFPALEDGLSWPIIIQNYLIDSFEKEFIYFKKKKNVKKNYSEHEIHRKISRLNKEVELPFVKEGLYAEIELSPNFYGKIASFFFKPQELFIILTLNDETKKNYRFISTMGKTKFLISPLIEDTQSFLFFIQGKNETFVKNIKIKGESNFWNPTYMLKLYKIEYSDE